MLRRIHKPCWCWLAFMFVSLHHLLAENEINILRDMYLLNLRLPIYPDSQLLQYYYWFRRTENLYSFEHLFQNLLWAVTFAHQNINYFDGHNILTVARVTAGGTYLHTKHFTLVQMVIHVIISMHSFIFQFFKTSEIIKFYISN